MKQISNIHGILVMQFPNQFRQSGRRTKFTVAIGEHATHLLNSLRYLTDCATAIDELTDFRMRHLEVREGVKSIVPDKT